MVNTFLFIGHDALGTNKSKICNALSLNLVSPKGLCKKLVNAFVIYFRQRPEHITG